jgi:predicted dehydrogenase
MAVDFRPPVAPRVPTTVPRLRVAVVGAGGWGEQHARVFADRTDTDLCAVVGRDAARTLARAEAYGTTAYTDLGAMLATERPDLVTVSLPNEAHFAPTLELLRHGVPLLVEKPLVFDLDEADTLVAEAERRGVFFAIDLNHRYAEPVLRAKRLLDAGELGDVVFATWRFGGEPNFGTSPHANLIETQVHGFDLVEHLCGPIVSVTAQMYDGARPGVFTTMAVTLELASGAVGTFLGTYDSSYAYPDSQRIEINATRGRLVIEDTVRRLVVSRPGDETSQVWQAGYFDDEARSFHTTFDRHVDAVLAALRAGEEPPVHARVGRRALELAHAVVRAAEQGVRVRTVPADVP